jgi:hypothetical protein
MNDMNLVSVTPTLDLEIKQMMILKPKDIFEKCLFGKQAKVLNTVNKEEEPIPEKEVQEPTIPDKEVPIKKEEYTIPGNTSELEEILFEEEKDEEGEGKNDEVGDKEKEKDEEMKNL